MMQRLEPWKQMHGADSKNADDAEPASGKLQLKALYDDFRNRLQDAKEPVVSDMTRNRYMTNQKIFKQCHFIV
jgi:hypothetical protein